jgi:hypothetical protein
MTQTVKLVAVATAVPPYILEQRDVATAAHRAFALRYTDFERLRACSRLQEFADVMPFAQWNGISNRWVGQRTR